jgi:hypothetical protein
MKFFWRETGHGLMGFGVIGEFWREIGKEQFCSFFGGGKGGGGEICWGNEWEVQPFESPGLKSRVDVTGCKGFVEFVSWCGEFEFESPHRCYG